MRNPRPFSLEYPNNPDFIQKDDFFENRENEKLFTKDTSNVKFRNMITGHLNGLTRDFGHEYESTFRRSKGNGIIRYINEPLINILGEIYNYNILNNFNRIVFEGFNRADFIYDVTMDGDRWMKKNSYCYELIAPFMTKAEITAQVKKDLERIFGIHASIEIRKIPCWVIKMDETQMEKIKKKKRSTKDLGSLMDMSGSFQRLKLPVLVETKFNDKIFPWTNELLGINTFRELDFSDLQRFVKENAITMDKEERELDVFVIKKAKQ